MILLHKIISLFRILLPMSCAWILKSILTLLNLLNGFNIQILILLIKTLIQFFQFLFFYCGLENHKVILVLIQLFIFHLKCLTWSCSMHLKVEESVKIWLNFFYFCLNYDNLQVFKRSKTFFSNLSNDLNNFFSNNVKI